MPLVLLVLLELATNEDSTDCAMLDVYDGSTIGACGPIVVAMVVAAVVVAVVVAGGAEGTSLVPDDDCD
jgi:hypothetical protein